MASGVLQNDGLGALAETWVVRTMVAPEQPCQRPCGMSALPPWYTYHRLVTSVLRERAVLTKEDRMNHIDDKEAIERLHKAGWTASEIERLCRLRRDYVEQEGGRAPADHRRFGFVRWLVALLQEGYGPSSPW